MNDPLLVRYGRWLWDALRGDLGTSYRYGQSVSSLIAQRLGPTLTLTALAFALIVAVSIPFGVLSAKYAGGRLDRALTVINQVVMAVPPFFTGILIPGCSASPSAGLSTANSRIWVRTRPGRSGICFSRLRPSPSPGSP